MTIIFLYGLAFIHPMKLVIDVRKSLEKNAEDYFELAKRAKKKMQGANDAIKLMEKKLNELKPVNIVKKVRRERQWFEKFHWFYSSEGFLCIGGRDSTTNEIIVKKHAKDDDYLFHTDAPGSPFFLIIKETKTPGPKTIEEVGQATAGYSKAWKLGLSGAEVFWVKGDQVSKQANAGEFIAKGAFMVRGKRNYLNPEIKLAIGIKDGVAIGGPISAIKNVCDKYVVVVPGDAKKSDVAKKIQKIIGGELDDIISALPGEAKLVKE